MQPHKINWVERLNIKLRKATDRKVRQVVYLDPVRGTTPGNFVPADARAAPSLHCFITSNASEPTRGTRLQWDTVTQLIETFLFRGAFSAVQFYYIVPEFLFYIRHIKNCYHIILR